MSRYDLGGETEDAFEPGSDGRVLRNKLGILDPDAMSRVETRRLALAIKQSHDIVDQVTRMDFRFVVELHRLWLGDLYPFAGELRTVNLSKGLVHFAPVTHLRESVAELDGQLRRFTPCIGFTREQLSEAIALTHSELVFVHPFREGNGRLSRWVADLMALQAGFRAPFWRFHADAEARAAYFAALRRGFLRDYEPLQNLMSGLLHEAR